MRLDAHAHIIPEDCTQLTFQDPEGRTHGVNARLRPDGSWDLEVDGLPRSPNDTSVEKPFQDWFVHSFDLERRFHYLDQLGIDAQVVATPHFLYPHAAEPSLGLAMAQRINNSLAKIASAHPQRLLVLATVPLQDPPAAIRELERAIDTLGLKGVVIDCNINGKNLDEAEFRDFFAKAEALQAPIFVHPRYSPNQPGMSRYHLANMVGVAMQTTLAAAHLIFGGVLDDFPGLKVYLPHSGGCVPFLCGRWDQGWRNVKAPREAISRPPSTYLRRFHYDTIAHSGRALSFVVDTVGADRMFLGTDYPFDVGDYQPIDHVQQVGTLSDEDKQRIIELNAPQFFGLA